MYSLRRGRARQKKKKAPFVPPMTMRRRKTRRRWTRSCRAPTPGALKALDALGEGDVLILGVAGKMGPTLARMVAARLRRLGQSRPRRRRFPLL
jgi:hypothetical protein